MTSTFTSVDEAFMARALVLAERGLFTTHPNPRVGCVLVRDGHIVGEGWHHKAGEPHAEVHALRAAGDRARGALAYVTLEPCSHQGRTGPCADALIAAGVREVVIASGDPNPQVNGAGIAKLQAAGIRVRSGLLQAAAAALNAGFNKRMQTGLPLVRIKLGMSVDARTALANGVSQWITSEASRADVQRWRARSSAILTGIGTVLADDPQLTVRDPQLDLAGRCLLRAVCDSSLRISAQARVLKTPGCVVYTTVAPVALDQAEVVQVAPRDQHVDLSAVLRDLATRGCNEVLVEAGATLAGAFIAQGLADELLVYVAPVLLGHEARALVQLPLLKSMSARTELKLLGCETLASDVRLHYQLLH